MRFLILIFLFGFAAARYYQAPEFEDARDKVLGTFRKILDNGPSLREALDMPYFEELDEIEEEVKEGVLEKVKNHFEELWEKLQKKVDAGKEVAKDLLNQIKDTAEKLKKLGGDITEGQKGLLEKLKTKFKDWFEKIKEIFKKKETRNIGEEVSIKFKEILEKILRKIIEGLDIEKIKEHIREKFEKAGDVLKDLDEENLEKLRKFLDLILRERKESRSISELWEKIKKWGKEIHIQFKEKWMNFAEWLKTNLKEFVEKVKDKKEKLKDVAIEMLKHTKEVTKEVAKEALDFFEPHKNELGGIWEEFKTKMLKIVQGKED